MRLFLFACVHSAGRSQMAAALFNRVADRSRARAIAAGTQPAERVHPVVVEAMREVGIDLSHARPQKLTDELAAKADTLITMGCGEQCPIVAGVTRDDWPLPDPAHQDLASVRSIRDLIADRVAQLIREQGLG
ncbi:MAG TPA: arsenate reductase ArsC [Acidobacteriaceae bacterium]|nr:arsenate reductase ArsC [Acidobacteriaceae bacterium]